MTFSASDQPNWWHLQHTYVKNIDYWLMTIHSKWTKQLLAMWIFRIIWFTCVHCHVLPNFHRLWSCSCVMEAMPSRPTREGRDRLMLLTLRSLSNCSRERSHSQNQKRAPQVQKRWQICQCCCYWYFFWTFSFLLGLIQALSTFAACYQTCWPISYEEFQSINSIFKIVYVL